MTRRVLFCEGPDDRSALREILQRIHGLKKDAAIPPAQEQRERLIRGDLALDLIIAGGRNQVIVRASDLAQYDSPAAPVSHVALCFDPNGDDEAAWRAWMESGIRALAPRSSGWNYACSYPRRTDLKVVPLPWLWPSPVRYGLPDNHCLERLAVDLLAVAYPQHDVRIERWVAEIRADPLPVTWKTAARLWNALIRSDASDTGFFAQVIGQHDATRDLLAQRLTATIFGDALASFLS